MVDSFLSCQHRNEGCDVNLFFSALGVANAFLPKTDGLGPRFSGSSIRAKVGVHFRPS